MDESQSSQTQRSLPEMSGEGKGSALSVFSPTQLMMGGAIAGALLLCSIGFFILLNMYLKGGNSFAAAGRAQPNTAGNVAPNQPDGLPTDAAPTKIVVRTVDPKTDHIRGNVNAKITLVSYTDFECPFCKRFHNTVDEVVEKYGKDVRVVYRNYPLDNLHRQARAEANAAECAGEQGKYWEFVDLIFKETTSNDGLDLGKLGEYGKRVGVNDSKFKTCLDTNKYASRVQSDQEDGESAGARGTPYTVVLTKDGETSVINGAQPFSAVEATIQKYL